MYRLSLFLNDQTGIFLIDEIWSSDEEWLSAEGQRRLSHNPNYLAVLTTFAPVSAIALERAEKSSVET